HAVRVALHFVAPALNEVPVGVVDVNGVGSVVADEYAAVLDFLDHVRIAPGLIARPFRPALHQLVRVRTGPEDNAVGIDFHSTQNGWRAHGQRDGAGGGGLENRTAGRAPFRTTTIGG